MTAKTPIQVFARVVGGLFAREEAARRYAELLNPTASATASAPTTLSLGAPRARRATENNTTTATTTDDDGARRPSLSLKD